ncbi:hypothetical protein DNTS_004392 [Danionella cerebrum]|uniref:Putative histone-lysine N-methyltransferase PRDM6 n=1 Tax=Danionella cerebrum TaxID=2873325 RepID=A0A553NHA2_9TELE|nr:hypothetical protein DNTS_004392 [Danionella translucida]
MLKPGEPSGSAFLKVDPSYLQHWQQLFPQKNAPVAVPLPVPVLESVRAQRAALLSGGSAVSSSSPFISSTAHPVASREQDAVLARTRSSEGGVAAPSVKELCLASSFKKEKSLRLKLSSEELDFYLYGQQRMEIIPINNHSGDTNNRCDMCADNREGECPMHGPLHSLRRLVGSHTHTHTPSHPSSAPPEVPACLRELPREVCVCTSSVPGLGFGICAAQRIPMGTWIGPFVGDTLPPEKLECVRNTRHLWEIYDQEGTLQHFIDGNEPSKSSWMRYIRCARHCGEQNMMVVQYRSCIFYRACADIPRGTELLVWYNDSYTSFFGIPLHCIAQDENLNVPSSVSEALLRPDTLQPFPRATPSIQRSLVFLTPPCPRGGLCEGVGGRGLSEPQASHNPGRTQRVLASPTSTSGLSSEFSDWHLWKCGQCFKTFTQRILLQMHVCTQNPDRPYQCGHCSQSFSQPSELRNHVVTHSSDRPFKCGYCGRAFAGATTLNNHIRTHTGEKPFRCERCERSFTQATQLSRHQRMPNECKPLSESSESIEVD